MSRPMSLWPKLLIGLLLALLTGWLSFGPLGQGEAYLNLLQQRAEFVLRISEVPNIQARIGRAPLTRTVFLCGPTIEFQRNGTLAWQGGANDLPGLDGRMLEVGGIAAVVWDPAAPTATANTPACRLISTTDDSGSHNRSGRACSSARACRDLARISHMALL